MDTCACLDRGVSVRRRLLDSCYLGVRVLSETITRERLKELQAQQKRGNRGANGHYDEDQVWWPSDIEEQHWKGTLKVRERNGEICDLERQVRYALHAAGGEQIGFYVADAVFWDNAAGCLRIQDVKSDRNRDTDLSDWKIKHMLAEYNIRVERVRVKKKGRRVRPWK